MGGVALMIDCDRLPLDWENPDFSQKSKVHDWKNYVSPDVESIWHSFSATQKQALAGGFQELADREEWE